LEDLERPLEIEIPQVVQPVPPLPAPPASEPMIVEQTKKIEASLLEVNPLQEDDMVIDSPVETQAAPVHFCKARQITPIPTKYSQDAQESESPVPKVIETTLCATSPKPSTPDDINSPVQSLLSESKPPTPVSGERPSKEIDKTVDNSIKETATDATPTTQQTSRRESPTIQGPPPPLPLRATDPRRRPKDYEPPPVNSSHNMETLQPPKKLQERLSSPSSNTKRPSEISRAHSPPKKKARVEEKTLYHYTLSRPATTLLTNADPEWSKYCICLDRQGDINLLDSELHTTVDSAQVRAFRYTTSFATHGTWIGPGSIVIAGNDYRSGGNQLTVIDYEDASPIRPIVTRLKPRPHDRLITSIVPLERDQHTGYRNFVTGGHPSHLRLYLTIDFGGDLYHWNVGVDADKICNARPIFAKTKDAISALAYSESRNWLFCASKRMLTAVDMSQERSVLATDFSSVPPIFGPSQS